jgi:hypothetical protein
VNVGLLSERKETQKRKNFKTSRTEYPREGNGKTKNCSSSPFYSIKPVCLGSYNLIETAEKFSPS